MRLQACLRYHSFERNEESLKTQHSCCLHGIDVTGTVDILSTSAAEQETQCFFFAVVNGLRKCRDKILDDRNKLVYSRFHAVDFSRVHLCLEIDPLSTLPR